MSDGLKQVKVARETYIPGYGNREAGGVFELPADMADELAKREGFELSGGPKKVGSSRKVSDEEKDA